MNPRTIAVIAAVMIAGFAGGFALERSRGTADVGPAVREYLLAHPEVLPEAMERLQQKRTLGAIAAAGSQLTAPYPGAVLGNPAGKRVLVEFTDYNCTYCRKSVADVAALVATDPDLKVVVRELPILAPSSAEAAKMALAAAEQGKYAPFHDAMFSAGSPDGRTIAAAAQAVGMDMARAAKVIADPRTEAELARNLDYARQLGINGTPAWITGNQLISGAIGREALARAIAGTPG